jgi:hypothetical protein
MNDAGRSRKRLPITRASFGLQSRDTVPPRWRRIDLELSNARLIKVTERGDVEPVSVLPT